MKWGQNIWKKTLKKNILNAKILFLEKKIKKKKLVHHGRKLYDNIFW